MPDLQHQKFAHKAGQLVKHVIEDLPSETVAKLRRELEGLLDYTLDQAQETAGKVEDVFID